MTYNILSFDGGGIRGLFSARILARLEQRAPGLLSGAQLIAGASTGGIIALGLAAGMTPEELVALYQTKANDIFDDSWLDNVLDIGNLTGAQYGSGRLKRLITAEFERRRGKRTLGDLEKRVLIPSFDLDNSDAPRARSPRRWKAKFFHNFPGGDSDGAELIVDVALRTTAAPSYFPSYQGYIDGGVVTNNPSVAALAQALHPTTGRQQLQDIRLLSIGTGQNPTFIAGKSLDWGWGQWARPLVSLMIDGVMDVAHYQCTQILDAGYHRIDTELPAPIALDATDAVRLRQLLDAADTYDLDAAVAWISAHWGV